MEQSSSYKESTIRHQFDRICKLALKGEVADYHKHLAYRQKHETMLSELSKKEWSELFTMDDYSIENHCFQVLGYDIEVKDALIAEALHTLSEKKRNVILLSYFMEMSDAEIAREMNLVRSTIHEHRKRSLELLKNIMEESTNGKEL
ncbi:MAG: sigma-70 family RNA polymerase sigma factor [Lachnospiraceae bacterium]|nr:sigma-70 family RNA polymerase sigma factor [Lachnospiraceae bacterium]